MLRAIVFFLLLIFLYNCSMLKPVDFEYVYDRTYTGLDTLINIDGYYIIQRECDSAFYSALMFYPDGLFSIITGSDLSDAAGCLADNNNRTICKSISWGGYRIVNDTIKTQEVRQEGMGFCTIFRDYIMTADKNIINISDYVIPENTKIGYMRNYPSFFENLCPNAAVFSSIQTKRNLSECPYLSKKWFNK